MMQRLILFFIVLFFSLNLSAQCFWLFQLEHNSSIIHELAEVKLRYKNKNDKWVRLKKADIFYGNQPELGVNHYYHLKIPNFVKEFELEIKNQRYFRKFSIFSIPDTMANGTLVLMNNVSMGSGNKRIPFVYAISKLHRVALDTNLITLDKVGHIPLLKSKRNFYDTEGEIKVDLKSVSEDHSGFVIPGCGAPGTRYVVQRWMQGDWYNYINTWEHKCVTTYHDVNSHVYAFRIGEKGIYRLLLKGIKYKNRTMDDFYSNVFIVR
jgi:hypothetical protein